MTLLALKLLLVPLLIAGITLAGEKLGPRVAGALTGLPVVAGPIVFLIALEQGPAFAARSAAATLAGIASLAAFCVLYAAAAPRSAWWVSMAIAWLGFGASTLLLDAIAPSLAAASALALAMPLVILAATPRPSLPEQVSAVSRGEIALRMAAGVGLALVLTAAARPLGPRLSGLLTVFPVATTILAVFSHRSQGAAFAIHLIRGLAVGLYSLTAFFLTLATTLERLGNARAFALAAVAAVGVQLLVLQALRRRARRRA